MKTFEQDQELYNLCIRMGISPQELYQEDKKEVFD